MKFDAIKAFEPKVVFASPVKSDELKEVNLLINKMFIDEFSPADNEYYTPTKWIPHCALAVKLNAMQFEKTKEVEEKIELPLIAKVQKAALARCNPYKEIKVWDVRAVSLTFPTKYDIL